MDTSTALSLNKPRSISEHPLPYQQTSASEEHALLVLDFCPPKGLRYSGRNYTAFGTWTQKL